MKDTPVVRLVGIGKRFGGTVAADGIDIELLPGEVHGLVGENGAGKSTLMKVLAGVHTDYDGTVEFAGQPVRFRSPRDARDRGVAIIHQELSNVGTLSVAENVSLARPPTRLGTVDWARMNARAKEQLAGLGIELDVRTRLGDLPIGFQQLVEIARVTHSGAQIIIFDEPTSALSPPEVERLFALMRQLKAQNRTMVFVSHFLDDVLAVCDRVTVLRAGRRVATRAASDLTKNELIDLVLGQSGDAALHQGYAGTVQLRGSTAAPVVLRTEALTRRGEFTDVSLTVRAGEILGVYGFLGCGSAELARCLFGLTRAERGDITIDGAVRRYRSAAAAKRLGVAYLHDDRPGAMFLDQEIYKNVTAAHLARLGRVVVRRGREMAVAREHLLRLGVTTDARQPVRSLSGGNQQKVSLARWMVHPPRVLLLNEPTRGVDVGAKAEVMRLVRGLAERGAAVLLLSAEPEAILAHSDRVLVMSRGRIAAEFAEGPLTEDMVLRWA
jgi:ribose transport system ATP-binding protein